MSGNPFKLHQQADNSYTVERTKTKIMGSGNATTNIIKLKWNKDHAADIEYLSLDEILSQVKEIYRTKVPGWMSPRTPFIRVWYETGMWGVIFEVGNYPDKGDQWIVHGVTKGYA